jgi:hypothetical protein
MVTQDPVVVIHVKAESNEYADVRENRARYECVGIGTH